MVSPHVHCIIDAFELTDTTIEILKDKVTEHLAKTLGPDFLLPDVKYSAIQDQKACSIALAIWFLEFRSDKTIRAVIHRAKSILAADHTFFSVESKHAKG